MNIRKATLREWRKDFAQYLRDLGIEANATERAVRGEVTPRKTDGIYRAMMRGDSTHARQRAESVVRELAAGGLRPELGKKALMETHRAVVEGWRGVADQLEWQGRAALSQAVVRFADSIQPPRTERELIASRLRSSVRARGADELAFTR